MGYSPLFAESDTIGHLTLSLRGPGRPGLRGVHLLAHPSPGPSAPPQSSLGTQGSSGFRDVTPGQVPEA